MTMWCYASSDYISNFHLCFFQRTCLRLLPEIFSTFSCLGAPQLLEKNPDGSHMRAFSMLMSAFLDLPMVSTGPHPVDLVSLEALAIALTATGSLVTANQKRSIISRDNSLLVIFVLHYCAGESFEKSFMRTPKSDRYGNFPKMLALLHFFFCCVIDLEHYCFLTRAL